MEEGGESVNHASEEDGSDQEVYHDAAELVSDVDNRYLSEDATVKEGKVELTEEQIKVSLLEL